jgi:hypothetical protein
MREPSRLLDRVRTAVRTRQRSGRTEEACLGWTNRKRVAGQPIDPRRRHSRSPGRSASESGMTPRRPVATLRPPQPIPRMIGCEPRSPSRRSLRHRTSRNFALQTIAPPPRGCHDAIRCEAEHSAAAAQCNLRVSWTARDQLPDSRITKSLVGDAALSSASSFSTVGTASPRS